jgi:hypothetical protein
MKAINFILRQKALVFIIVISVFTINTIDAQYKINKETYSFKDYERETTGPHSPGVNAFASFLVPGLGQALGGEPLRGLIFLASDIGSFTIGFIGLYQGLDSNTSAGTAAGALVFLAGMVGTFAVIPIWSAIDASRVAKVNNMAYNDRQKLSSLNVHPHFQVLPNNKISSGLTLSLNF